MTRALSIVAGCTVLSTVVGTGVGYALGVMTPDFVLALFGSWADKADPVQIGLGLGMVNGGLVGIAVGSLIMGMLTWHDLRMKQLQLENRSP